MSKVIGITGGIATGKSTVSELLTAYGFKIVDADIASREAVKKALRVLNKLKRFLGKKQLTKMVR
ncbi:dephospho-CoA kinase [Staphylococcus epidermidis]|nr:dephospho-CoA kinase [Staphylococcus epidermidis]